MNSNFKPIISTAIIGVGDAGIEALKTVNNKSELTSLDFIYANTNKKSLENLDNTLYLNAENVDLSLGDPLFGKVAASNSIDQIKQKLENVELLILVAGFGGGTGTGALPFIAKTAKEMGILTIAIVTTPFSYEGNVKDGYAKQGLDDSDGNVDSLFIISNNRLINNYPDIIATDAFKLVNNILKNCINTFINLISSESVINNLTITQLTSAIKNKGQTYIGFGNGMGKNKINRIISNALNSKIVETTTKDLTNVVLNIVGDPTVSIKEIDEIVSLFTTRIKNDKLEVSYKFSINPKFVNEIQLSMIGTCERLSTNLEKSFENKKLQNSQELLISINNTLENDIKPYVTGELDLKPVSNFGVQQDDKGQDDFFINSEESNDDDDIPFFLK